MTIKINYQNLEKWEKNYLGIETLEDKSKLFFYFKFLKSRTFKKIEGDIVEAGVYKGSSLISTALLLKNENILNKISIWGYDTFKGFPKLSKFDDPKYFSVLYKNSKISKKHFDKIKKLKKNHKILKSKKISATNISTSNNFENSNLNILKKKIRFLKINKNINLIQGEFKRTMKNVNNLPKKISAGLIDCDLYEGYKTSLNFFWPRLAVNGKLFLDEYYSLKFPGPRFIIDEFIKKNKNAKLIKEGISGDFERWSLKKL